MKMNNLKKLAVMGLLAATTMAMAGCGGNNDQPAAANGDDKNLDKEMVTIGIIQQAEHSALEEAKQGFMDGLKANGFEEGITVTFDAKNALNDPSNLQTIAQGFNNQKVDLICAIGTSAAQSAAQATAESQIPVVATAVTDYETAKLVESNDKPNTNVTGTSDMNPVKEQLDLLVTLVPDIKTVGVVYTSSESNSELQVSMLKEYAQTLELDVMEATVTSVNDIQQAVQSLSGKVQGLYVPTDNIVASAIPTLLNVTEAEKLPIICGEAGMVEAGGTATLGIDYYALGLQTGEMAARILNGESKPADMPIEFLKDMTVTINKGAADRIELTFPADLIEKAGDNIIE